jgi:membrane peptidoglycan carboxypeptidase
VALLIGVSLALIATIWEAQTSELQSRFFGRWSSALSYTIEPRPNPQIAFPDSGPFDQSRGYTRLPDYRDRLEGRGFRITEQARQTPALARLIRSGIPPPYREPSIAGLVIRDKSGTALFDPANDRRVFHRFEDVPPLLVETLLFIENRRIGGQAGPRENPAIDWPRSARALFYYTGRKLGLDFPLEGGSTLATQLEKYRHSPGGRTSSPMDKLRQVVGASLEAYHTGPDTHDARKQIILDCLNTMPLGAAPNVGEVYGLGDGLRAWFKMDLAYVHAALEQPQTDIEKARAYRHVLALLYAVHAPTRYLARNHRALESRIDAYSGLLQSAGIIDARLLILMQRIPLEFAVGALPEGPPRFVEHKAVNAVRLEVARLLDVPNFYDLDRLHVRIDSTIDGALQDQVTRVLRQLASPTFVAANGLHEPRMLARGAATTRVSANALAGWLQAGGLAGHWAADRCYSGLVGRSSGVIRSSGNGNTIVEVFSLEISASVWR